MKTWYIVDAFEFSRYLRIIGEYTLKREDCFLSFLFAVLFNLMNFCDISEGLVSRLYFSVENMETSP